MFSPSFVTLCCPSETGVVRFQPTPGLATARALRAASPRLARGAPAARRPGPRRRQWSARPKVESWGPRARSCDTRTRKRASGARIEPPPNVDVGDFFFAFLKIHKKRVITLSCSFGFFSSILNKGTLRQVFWHLFDVRVGQTDPPPPLPPSPQWEVAWANKEINHPRLFARVAFTCVVPFVRFSLFKQQAVHCLPGDGRGNHHW